MSGDEALAIIDRYRAAVHDEVRVEPLEHEFPYYVHTLGAEGVFWHILKTTTQVCLSSEAPLWAYIRLLQREHHASYCPQLETMRAVECGRRSYGEQ